jgi:hypothetical protein
MRRRCFPAVVKLLDHIMGNLAALPAGADVDVNNVAMRLALDMTGARTSCLQIAQPAYYGGGLDELSAALREWPCMRAGPQAPV